jgi:hypothetical protein
MIAYLFGQQGVVRYGHVLRLFGHSRVAMG